MRSARSSRSATGTYEERTTWASWVGLVVWGPLVVAALGVLAGAQPDLSARASRIAALGMLGAGAAVRVVFGELRVRVDSDGIFLHLGMFPILRRRVAFDEIERVEVVRYRPLLEFGGWGIRGVGRKKAWTMRGDEAVRLHLTGDRLLYIGSDTPGRLAERIRAIGAVRPLAGA